MPAKHQQAPLANEQSRIHFGLARGERFQRRVRVAAPGKLGAREPKRGRAQLAHLCVLGGSALAT
eukprot:11532965-Alexandrium_andersonii.AAC.1